MLKLPLSALGSALILSVVVASTLRAAPTEMYQGNIAAVGTKSIMLISRQGENLSFAVADDCMVMLDGKQVSLTMLGIGNTVRITAALDGTARVAKRIDARAVE